MIRSLLVSILFIFSFAPTGLIVQERWQMEARAGFVDPSNNLASVELDTGANFGGSIAYQFVPRFAGYFGWG